MKGDVDVRTDASSYLHPNCTNANNWTCVGAQVFTSQNYYGLNATSAIYFGETNPVIVPGH
ncbi:MAG: hypothetical protein MZU91_06940 [Desulfosudis oleivorans]|nr:hypothetical protein [Desulfosudis oleivorans]